jgi:sulfate ABC transporter permease protein CysW/sulfate ABC transporter permease protein CysT
MARRSTRVLPGLPLALSWTVLHLGLLVLLPLGAVVFAGLRLPVEELAAMLASPRVTSAFMLSFAASAVAGLIAMIAGTLVAWALVRRRFPGRWLIDALVDLPFALPTAVAGIALTAVYAKTGVLGKPLASLGIELAYNRAGVVLALVFVGLPFVVRAVQPVLETLDPTQEQAAMLLGASRWQTFRAVIVPQVRPAALTGFLLAFARGLGEYGSVIFIAGNMPMKTEIVPLLIMTELEQFAYPEATALGLVMLVVSLLMLLAINVVQARLAKRVRLSSGNHERAKSERSGWQGLGLTLIAIATMLVLVMVPVLIVLHGAFAGGVGAWWHALTSPDTRHAVGLTLAVVGVTLPLVVAFGLAAAWALAKFEFPGRRLLISLIDLPFAVSPVIAGMAFVLLFGGHTELGRWLADHDLRIVFAFPGLVLATVFVTTPMVARELLPLLEGQGNDQELAALTLGASGWQTVLRVTLPRIRWALIYGIALATARAVGEFGAVSVVSGHVRGRTNTLSLHVEALYSEYDAAGAFAVATLLLAIAFGCLAIQRLVLARVSPTKEPTWTS